MTTGDATPPPAPFVVGAGRSGTTLLRLMLDAHPELAIPPETRFVPKLIAECRGQKTSGEAIAALLAGERNWADFGVDAAEVGRRIDAAGRATPASAVRSFYHAYADRFGKRRWGDKTPAYATRMPMIGRAVPEARFIHLIRDPRDVAVSWHNFRSSRGMDPYTPAHWAHFWVSRVVEARIKAARVDHYLEIPYDDLVTAPEQTLEQICGFIELPYDEQMMLYHLSAEERLAELGNQPAKGEQPGRSADIRRSPHKLTNEPPRADRIGAWREVLSEDEAAEIEAICGELLTELDAASA